jgi:hypothetical protein
MIPERHDSRATTASRGSGTSADDARAMATNDAAEIAEAAVDGMAGKQDDTRCTSDQCGGRHQNRRSLTTQRFACRARPCGCDDPAFDSTVDAVAERFGYCTAEGPRHTWGSLATMADRRPCAACLDAQVPSSEGRKARRGCMTASLAGQHMGPRCRSPGLATIDAEGNCSKKRGKAQGCIAAVINKAIGKRGSLLGQ